MNKEFLSKDKDLRNKVTEKYFSIIEDLFLSENFSLDKKKEDLFLREIFDIGRLLGLKISNNRILSLQEISEEIYKLNIECLSGKWESKEENKYIQIERNSCPYKAKSKLICLYWREFIDGFVMGIGDEERYSRHSSINYGQNSSCIDTIYYNDFEEYRWGKVPDNILSFVLSNNEKYSIKGIEIKTIGFNEKTFFYKIKDSGEISSFRRGFISESFTKNFKKNFPDLEIIEMSPRAVIEGDF